MSLRRRGYLVEKIAPTVREPRRFMQIVASFLNRLSKTMKALRAEIKRYDPQAVDDVVQKATDRYIDLSSMLYFLDRSIQMADKRGSHFEWMSKTEWNVETFSNFIDSLERMYHDVSEVSGLRDMSKHLRAMDKEEVEYALGSWDLPKSLLKAIVGVSDVYDELSKKSEFFYKRAQEGEAARTKISVRGTQDLGNAETMYHATANLNEIAKNGFVRQGQSRGLGGETGGMVSFTSDLYVAKEIARSLKEVALIAQGQVKAHHVLDWAKRAGIKEKLLDSYRGMGDPSIGSPQDVFMLYTHYLAHNPKRYNPVYFGGYDELLRFMRTKKQRDIGIIKARVDTSGAVKGSNRFFPSMMEYRVKPEEIIKIEKVLR